MKTSRDGLINVSQLNKVLKKSDTIFWSRYENIDIVSDGHWVIRADLIDRSTLYQLFGREPKDGQVLCTRKYGREWQSHDAGESMLETFKKFLDADDNYIVLDTKLTADIGDGRTVRLFDADNTYVAIASHFWEMIAETNYTSIGAEKVSKVTPLAFRLGEEVAVILPVNYQTVNQYLRVAV